jgi:hypothetical protein
MEANKALFVRRYEVRTNNTNSWRTLDEWFTIYTEKGETVFLNELEDQEEYTEFCKKYYDVLRDAFNICTSGMWDYYQMYKVKFGSDEAGFRNELRHTIKNFDKRYS